MMVAKWMEQSIIVRGANRSAIYDLNRYKLYLVDLEITELIRKIEEKNQSQIYSILTSIEMEWFEYLKNLELINFVPKNCFHNFPILSLAYHSPQYIYEIAFHENNDINKCLELIKILNCHHVTLILETDRKIEQILHEHFKKTDLFAVDIFINQVTRSKVFFKDLVKDYPVINQISNSTIDCHDNSNGIVHYLGMNTFLESHHHNVHFYRKLYIDEEGWIRNTPQTQRSLLNIDNAIHSGLLKKILNNKTITKYWNSSKDKTITCKNCEYRYQCIDTRTPKYNKYTTEWYFESECGYNPITSKWSNDTIIRNVGQSVS